MDVVWRRFEGEGFSIGVIDLFMTASRDKENAAHASAWQVRSDNCVGRDADLV
jgi:hypothetical protein